MSINFSSLPASLKLKSNSQLNTSIFLFKMMDYPWLIRLGQVMMPIFVRIPGIKQIIKATIFRQFCGGETLEEVKQTIEILAKYNINAIADYSAEQANTTEEQEITKENILASIAFARGQNNVKFACVKITGICSRTLLEKISSKENLSASESQEKAAFLERLDILCDATAKAGIKIFIDAEESWINPAINEAAEIMMAKYNTEKPVVYTTIQMYAVEGLPYLKHLIENAPYHIGVKLVRGAYHEKENEKAEKMGYPTPILPNKEATDKSYDEGIGLCLQHKEKISFCAATHNIQSVELLIEAMEKAQIPSNSEEISFSQLFGMRDNLTYELAKHGYNVSKYIPYGPLKETIPYLIRRATENAGINSQMGEELQLLLKEKKSRKKA